MLNFNIEKLDGKNNAELDQMLNDLKKLEGDIHHKMRENHNEAIAKFVESDEGSVINLKLNGKLKPVLKKYPNLSKFYEIVLGSMYNLCRMHGENIPSLMVESGLFTKKHYYQSNEMTNYEWRSEEDMLKYFEVNESTGVKIYGCPITGEAISESEFFENCYYTLVPTDAYFDVVNKINSMC